MQVGLIRRGWSDRTWSSSTNYKEVSEVKLHIWVYWPKDSKRSEPPPGMVFSFGGGFVGGSPGQFEQQCKYFASRGTVAMTADYRVRNRHCAA